VCDHSELIAAARKARSNSYSPYSNFAVGAAVISESGGINQGCNVENASYGLTICAERNAIFSAVASGAKKISAIAISVGEHGNATPCGACLQVMSEFANDEFRVLIDGQGTFQLKELLPKSFKLVPPVAVKKSGLVD